MPALHGIPGSWSRRLLPAVASLPEGWRSVTYPTKKHVPCQHVRTFLFAYYPRVSRTESRPQTSATQMPHPWDMALCLSLALKGMVIVHCPRRNSLSLPDSLALARFPSCCTAPIKAMPNLLEKRKWFAKAQLHALELWTIESVVCPPTLSIAEGNTLFFSTPVPTPPSTPMSVPFGRDRR